MPPSLGELVGQAGRLGDGDAPQALGQLLERRGARQHRRDEPLPRPGNVPATDPRQQPGPHDAGLAGSRTADDQHEPSAQVVAAEPGEDLVDEVGTAEEVGGVGLVERPQPLVRVRERLVAGGLGAGERGDEHRHELRHRRPAGRRHAAGQDLGDRAPVARAGTLCTITAKSCTSSLAVRVGSAAPRAKSAR